ncbi:hypothetical protein Hanom_Chr06g00484931 [Helianthus anomalus]
MFNFNLFNYVFINNGGSRNFFQWVRFGRFSLFFSKSYKVLTNIFQTEWVHVNPQNRAGSAIVYKLIVSNTFLASFCLPP